MTVSRRVLITGLSSQWGGRLAQLLERDKSIETVIGIDTEDPRHELQRTEFVRVGTDDALLRRIIRAAAIDTVVDTRLIPDALLVAPRRAHQVNVEGTRSVLQAAGGTGSPVRKLIFKSSAHYYGSEKDAPAFFTEEMPRTHPPRSSIEHDVAQAERALAEFSRENPRMTVTIMRCAAAIGGELRSAHLALLGLPVVPSILGFDPRWQFIHEDDVVGVLAHAVTHDLPGAYNAAADGVLTLSEVVSLLGKTPLPVLPPWGTVFAAVQLRRLGLRVPVEMLRDLRFGRGLDNRRLKATGYSYRFTSRESVLKLRAHQRLRPLLGSGDESYRYEREVEDFLRWSPSVQAAMAPREVPAMTSASEELDEPSTAPGEPAGEPAAAEAVPSETVNGYDDLTEDEVLEVIGSLETEAMHQLREYEVANQGRRSILAGIDYHLARRRALRTR